MPGSFDYVVIGAGVAGCVMAARLSEKSANAVLLVESGRDFALGLLTGRRVDLVALAADRERLREHVRENVAGMFHPAGSCRMGRADDAHAVVDTAGRVFGVSGLRVVDASVMPTLPAGNTNVPVIMIAEKMAAAMLSGA